ncbi:uncharacterized protein PV06_07504 [Exophiala oligosperma]|uniref:GST N-terminal domain-containing protein n=1 Tax=Exophiala oligosperma TaxID=215243 RepID=A0A0D2DB07_9EURO|nr:uncharacterized protein PV06_07504 [Exophiala oligosperma]KIW40293.1 hypothetical protein PV06_07504 [Exophiala oligosperma]
MAPDEAESPSVVLFGYDSSPFTQKARLALQLKQIPYTFVIVPSMMPRPLLRESFNLTYRKIPVLVIGREIYIDTSLIVEALEHYFPSSQGYGSLYPDPVAMYRPLIRGLASYWTDRPLFRVTTGLIPATVWRTHFGTDRSNLIGHKLNADKLEHKIPENLSVLDLQLSLAEPLFQTEKKKWVFEGDKPSAADVALWYQLDWGEKISRGEGIENLTGGGTRDGDGEGTAIVFNPSRYPGVVAWFERVKKYFEELPSTETRVESRDTKGVGAVIEAISRSQTLQEVPLLPTPSGPHFGLDARNGLVKGVEVSVAPDDTGRESPTVGTLAALTPEEIVIVPQRIDDGPRVGQVRIHFPRVGFVVRPVGRVRL